MYTNIIIDSKTVTLISDSGYKYDLELSIEDTKQLLILLNQNIDRIIK